MLFVYVLHFVCLFPTLDIDVHGH